MNCSLPVIVVSCLLLFDPSVSSPAWADEPSGDESARPETNLPRDTRQPSSDTNDMLERLIEEMVWITPGTDPYPTLMRIGTRQIRPTRSFQVSRYETTQELYEAVMETNPSRWPGPRNAVDSVSRRDADVFCRRITVLLRHRQLIEPSQRVRLPTDVEWEYCCRAGSAGAFCFSESASDHDRVSLLDDYGWYTGNAAGKDPAVGVLQPNAFGLYDMHGYLWEYVDGQLAGADASGSVTCFAMGGSWRDPAELLKSDSRIPMPVYAVSDAIGFRCVIAADRDD